MSPTRLADVPADVRPTTYKAANREAEPGRAGWNV